MKRILIISLLSMLIIGTITGCGFLEDMKKTERSQKAEYTIGVVLKAMDSQHWLDMRTGMQEAAKHYNINLVVMHPQKESDVTEQKQMIFDLMDSSPDAIIFAPCDSDDCRSIAEAAEEKQIKILTVDTKAQDVQIPFVGADNERIGKMAATRLAGECEKKGDVIVISGVKNQSSHEERIDGFSQTLSGYPEINLANIYYADSDFRLGIQAMKTALEEQPNLCGVFCTNAVMSLGAVEYLESIRKTEEISVVAVDTQDDALAALRAGKLSGLVTQDGYQAGYMAVSHMVEMLSGENAQDEIFIDTELLTPESAQSYQNSKMQ